MNTDLDLCDFCSGILGPGKTTMQFWLGEQLVVVRDLPADVCQQCGEAYLSAEVSGKLDIFLTEDCKHRPEQILSVPAYSARQLLGS